MKMKFEKFCGKRLKDAMQLREMKMTELAEKTGIKKQSLSLYANDINNPPVENVFKIANILNIPYQFFMTESLQTIETGRAFFRSQASATKRARSAASKKMQYVALLYEVLLSKIDFPKLNLPDTSKYDFKIDFQNPDSDEAVQRIEDLAEEVRNYWKLGNGPIDNIQYVLESNGIVVTGFTDTGTHIDAYSQKIIVDDRILYLVALEIGEKPFERLRFDMAHELGHILMHGGLIEEDELSKEEFSAMEKQANMFASAFLLPRIQFSRMVAAYPTTVDYYRELKKTWKVSMQAMMYRTWQLEIITSNQFQYMMRQVSKKGWRMKEPGDVPGHLQDNLFQGAIDLLIDGGYMSKQEIMAEFAKRGIALRYRDLEKLMCLKKETLAPEKKVIQPLLLRIK